MEPTKEQKYNKELAKSNNISKLDAIAGSGKTANLVMIAKEIVEPSLYLAFNKSMQVEADRKFPMHVTCKTVHGLAYSVIGKAYSHKLNRPRQYKNVAGTGNEISKFFKIDDLILNKEGDYISAPYLGLMVKDMVARFEQSGDQEINSDHFPVKYEKDLVGRYNSDVDMKKVKALVFSVAKKLWAARIDKDSPVLISHDTYLKLYQLSQPDLSANYKVIYVDESQDSNGVTLALVLSHKNKCKLVFVGDNRQAIYQWRGSVNAMNLIDCGVGSLTKSFRYGTELAEVATKILGGKVQISGNEDIDTKVGAENVLDYDKPYTILYRTNSNMVSDALTEIKKGTKVKVSLDLRSLVSMLRSAEALYQGEIHKVKDENVIPFTCWADFKTEGETNKELGRISKMVENNEVSRVIGIFSNYEQPTNPDVIMTTAHKSKGLEFDQVVLADDFPSNYDKEGTWRGLAEEEENLLYVSATRAIERLQYNTTVQEILDLPCLTKIINKEAKVVDQIIGV